MNWIRACTCVVAVAVAVAVLLYMRMCGARPFSVLHGNALACFCLSCMGLCLLVSCALRWCAYSKGEPPVWCGVWVWVCATYGLQECVALTRAKEPETLDVPPELLCVRA